MRTNAEQLRKVVVKETELYPIIFAAFGFEFVFILLWALVATPVPVVVPIAVGEFYVPTCFSGSTAQTLFWAIFLVIKFGLLGTIYCTHST